MVFPWCLRGVSIGLFDSKDFTMDHGSTTGTCAIPLFFAPFVALLHGKTIVFCMLMGYYKGLSYLVKKKAIMITATGDMSNRYFMGRNSSES